MPARLIQLVLLIALLFAPMCMMGSGAAWAIPEVAGSGEQHARAATPGHCAEIGEQPEGEQDESADLDCRTTCSGVLAQMPVLRGTFPIVSMPQNVAIAAAQPGLNPAAELPPPRLS
jgi:hypothetical protein